jgi:hypothetical protein
MTLPGTPFSWAQLEYVRRKVSHVARRIPRASHAGYNQRRLMLFGEIGLPDHVPNTSAWLSIERPRRQDSIKHVADADNGIWRRPASVLGVSNVPRYIH